jgi:hypothetical protein
MLARSRVYPTASYSIVERKNAMSARDLESGVAADRSVGDREQEELLHDEIERLPAQRLPAANRSVLL